MSKAKRKGVVNSNYNRRTSYTQIPGFAQSQSVKDIRYDNKTES